MPNYRYKTLTIRGAVKKESGNFSSLQKLFEAVDHRNETLVDYQKSLFPTLPKVTRGLKRATLAEFFRNLALLLKGGVPLRGALDDMTVPPCNSVLAETFQKIGSRIDEGLMFSEAIQEKQSQAIIPRIMYPLITIGEETGNLDKTLEDGANHIDRIENIVSSTRRALVYPSVVLVSMFGALAFWMLFVLPQIMDLFSSMGLGTLPLATRILLAATAFFSTWWPVFPALLLFFIVFYQFAKHNDTVHYAWDRFWDKVPLIKSISKASQLAFFFEYTAMLTAAGINIIRSMELMEQSISNQILKRAVLQISREINAGNPVSEAIASFPYFEPFVLRMVRVGEQTGNLPEQFNILANHYMEKVDKLVSAMSKTIEPLIIIIAGIIFAVIAIGLLGPIYNMISEIS